jgi:O-antigen/teichoic acid export membrane protein
MSSTRRKLTGHTSIYMFGEILRNSVSVIMLPIYTRYLTPADYGVIELLTMLIDMASIIFGARVAQAIFRFYCTATTPEDKNSIITSALFLSFLFNLFGAVTITLLSRPLSLVIYADYSYQHYIVLFTIVMALIPLSDIPLTHIRAQQRPWLFFSFSVIKLIIQVSLNIYFVVIKEMHVEGVIYSTLIASATMGLALSAYSLRIAGLRINITVCKMLFSFSLPIKLAAIGSFYLTFGDRYILNIYTNLTQVGIYSLAYKFGFVFTIIAWDAFENMWDAEKYAIYEKPDAKIIYQKVFLYMSCVLISVGLSISLFIKDFINVMSDPAFHSAYRIVPIIILAYIIQSWGRYCDLGIFLKRKTIQIAYAHLIAAVVITAAYFTLIPEFGIYGAAWATVIGFTARFYWINRIGKEYYDMELPWGNVFLMATLAVGTFIASLFIPEGQALSIFLRLLLLLIFFTGFYFLPILDREEKRELLKMAFRHKFISHHD